MHLLELIEATSVASYNEVSQLVKKIHGRPQDFSDGDLIDRLSKFNSFILKDIPLSDLDLDEFYVDDALVDDFIKKLKDGASYPPIVYDAVDMSIIDGIHRANALARAGHKTIRAYVGTVDTLDPDWSNDSDEWDD